MSEWQEIAQQRPKDVDEALPCMRRALDYFHAHNDYRAVFLRAYYIITLEVHAAVHQLGDYKERIFFDPGWVKLLAGKFANLYFQSLTTDERPPESEKAWKLAHKMATEKSSTVLQDLILGINAHINYDLAYGNAWNLKEHGDHADHLLLPRRKFDHDQINNLLVRCAPRIQQVLTRDYGGGMMILSRFFGNWDERLTGLGLKYYRERVWWNAVSFLCAGEGLETALVHDKLNWESYKVAKFVTRRVFWQQVVWFFGRLLRKRRFGRIEIEGIGGMSAVQGKTATRLKEAVQPF
ncbi:MAG TPA: DUF5995 family protein [Thermoanaerobaculia bacterium]|nr:DUF5995 family protein [Thermoanaerobaculia bacterium]